MDEGLKLIEYGLAGMPLKGEEVSGDSYIIKPFQNGLLMAVMDGLGHGYEAAQASVAAIATLKNHADDPIIPLVVRCHEALKGTRGVVMSVASFNSTNNIMTWLGVGNVEVILLREDGNKLSKNRPLLRGGVLGYQLPPLRETALPVMRGDTLIFVTDGIKSSFESEIRIRDKPQQIADSIMTRFARGTDDALVLVVRYICET